MTPVEPTGWQKNLRPITPDELEHLKALGAEVKELRRASGLTAFRYCERALLSESQFWKIGGGFVRTRRSTLERLVAAAVEANPDLGPAGPIVDRLCQIAGPALAAESLYADRLARRMARRARRRDRGTWVP